MPTDPRVEQYRRKAAEARQAAAKFPDNSPLKVAYVEAERAWLALAEQAERNVTPPDRPSDPPQQQREQQQRGTESDESDEKDEAAN